VLHRNPLRWFAPAAVERKRRKEGDTSGVASPNFWGDHFFWL